MDAHIDIESTPGEGTTVIVRVPQVIADSTEIGYDAAQELMNFQNIKRNISREHQVMPEAMPYGRVLIADDVPANLFVAKGLMSFYDLQIDTCTSGDETIEKVRRGEVYDVIFMDHTMPEKSGVETLQELRGMGYTAPVVVLTANALIGHAEQFLYVGFDGYLSKPIQTRNLDNLLRKFVRDKQPPDVLAHAATGRKARTIRFDSYQTSPELLAKLRADFAAEQRGVMDAVRDAIAHGDMKKAHLLAHTLKGRAGLIYERALVAAAEAAELMLKNGSGVSEGTLVALENELNRVLAGSVVVEPHKINAQLDILEPMLAPRSAKSRKHLDELRLVPQAAILVKQVEKLDFAAAAQSLGALRLVMNELGQNNP
jgi:CheY-like chemotaxis protein